MWFHDVPCNYCFIINLYPILYLKYIQWERNFSHIHHMDCLLRFNVWENVFDLISLRCFPESEYNLKQNRAVCVLHEPKSQALELS